MTIAHFVCKLLRLFLRALLRVLVLVVLHGLAKGVRALHEQILHKGVLVLGGLLRSEEHTSELQSH